MSIRNLHDSWSQGGKAPFKILEIDKKTSSDFFMACFEEVLLFVPNRIILELVDQNLFKIKQL